MKVVTAEGVRITDKGDWNDDEVVLANPAENRKRIAQAVQVAQGADAIVLAIGGTAATSREAWADNHLGDSTSLELVGEQNELARALFALGKPVVVVLINGRPQAVSEVAQKANALLEGWYLGQEGGTAMADILFGDANPGGKLPITLPRSAGQLPLTYNEKPSSHRGYLFDSKDPLFAFGFGLSYTTFEIGAPKLSATQIPKNGAVTVSVDVRNTGKVAGDEVVQLYLRRRGEQRHAPEERAERLQARHARARRLDDGEPDAGLECARPVGQGHEARRGARRVPRHGGAELHGPEISHPDRDPLRARDAPTQLEPRRSRNCSFLMWSASFSVRRLWM